MPALNILKYQRPWAEYSEVPKTSNEKFRKFRRLILNILEARCPHWIFCWTRDQNWIFWRTRDQKLYSGGPETKTPGGAIKTMQNQGQVPSNVHISTPLFQKTVYFSKICFGTPLLKIFGGMSKFRIYMWKWWPVYNFNSARTLKKLLSSSVEVTSSLPNSDTQKDLLM